MSLRPRVHGGGELRRARKLRSDDRFYRKVVFTRGNMAYREFRDEVGATWRVWDTYPERGRSVVNPALQGGWLTFEHDHARRRLVPAPDRWTEADVGLLREWLTTATPVVLRMRDMDLPFPIPVVSDDPVAHPPRGADSLPHSTEDLRRLLERSRETIDIINRAIGRTPDPVDEPPPLPDGGERE